MFPLLGTGRRRHILVPMPPPPMITTSAESSSGQFRFLNKFSDGRNLQTQFIKLCEHSLGSPGMRLRTRPSGIQNPSNSEEHMRRCRWTGTYVHDFMHIVPM